jgi:hypothetical protein
MRTYYSRFFTTEETITSIFHAMQTGKHHLAANMLYRLFDQGVIDFDDANFWVV